MPQSDEIYEYFESKFLAKFISCGKAGKTKCLFEDKSNCYGIMDKMKKSKRRSLN
jgi:hypothetical protein